MIRLKYSRESQRASQSFQNMLRSRYTLQHVDIEALEGGTTTRSEDDVTVASTLTAEPMIVLRQDKL